MAASERERPMPAGADERPAVSAYVRTLDEERMIADVVAAALRVAREVIVVDSGSQDATVALAEAAGARVIREPWRGVGRQKRVGEDAAAHDWLLDLDADEVVTPELAAEIAALFAAGEPAAPAYRIPLVTVPPFGEPWYGVDVARRAKLYDRRRVRAPDSTAWDQFPVPPDAGRLRQPILHHAFTGIEHVMNKVNRNTTARAEAALKPLPVVVLRIVFAFPVYFAKRYFLKGLVRKGVYGFAYAVVVASGRWLRDVKMYEIHMKARRRR